MPINKLTLKQKRFIKYYLESGNASQSALKAGYKNRQSAFMNMSNVVIKDTLYQYMERQGLTEKKLLEVLVRGLEAYKLNSKDKKSADHATRHKFLETALKLKELLRDKVEVSGEIKGGEKTIIILNGKHNAKSNSRESFFERIKNSA